MIASFKFLLFVPLLTLTSCATSRPKPPAYLPPRIDCAELDAPRKKAPAEIAPAEKSLIIWQLHVFAWKDYAESLLEQRFATAVCIQGNREAGNIR